MAQVVVREHEIGVDVDGAPQRRLGFVEPSQLAADDPDVVEDREGAGVVRQRLTERAQRRRGLTQLAERRAEVAERGGEGRHQVGGALEGVARPRQVVEHEPQLAALVGDRLPLRRQRRGAIERRARGRAVARSRGRRSRARAARPRIPDRASTASRQRRRRSAGSLAANARARSVGARGSSTKDTGGHKGVGCSSKRPVSPVLGVLSCRAISKALQRSPSLKRLRRATLQRRAIRGRDDAIVLVEPIDPRLHQVRRLCQHEPRAADLRVRKRELEIVDADDARAGGREAPAG